MLLTVLIQVIGGLALFLLGINFLSNGMERFAGAKMQKLIENLTSNRLKGFGVGMFSSALTQSSSMVMVSMIGMMNAGLMSLNQGIGLILGFEIGTTITAQLVAFDIGNLFLAAVAIGFFLYYLSKRLRRRYLGQLILGLGIVFMGMSLMKEAMAPLSSHSGVLAALVTMGAIPILGVLTGFVLTSLIQSSSATVGLLIAMGAGGVITLPAAIAIGIGSNIGTCVTGLLASIGGSRAAKQAVTAQVLTALIGALLFLPFIHAFAGVIELTALSLPRQIANAHTVNNIIVSVLMLPLIGLMARLVKAIVPDSRQERAVKIKHVEPGDDPAIALKMLQKEALQIGLLSQEMLNRAGPSLLNARPKQSAKDMRKVNKTEDFVDKYTKKIENSLNNISGAMVTKALAEQRVALGHTLMDIERVADLALNLMEYTIEIVESKDKFDRMEKTALLKMIALVSRAYATALEAFEKQSPPLAREVRFIEEGVDALDAAEHKAHLRRLDRGISDGRSSVIFVNAMHDLERISDHADNIAKTILALHEKDSLLPD